MSGVVLIICVPTKNHEQYLQKKIKKKVTIDARPKFVSSENDCVMDILEEEFKPLYASPKSEPENVKKDDPMEETLQSILKQFNIENFIWSKNEEDNYLQVIFSIESSDRCEDILEVLKENRIGLHLNSNVSVIPCTLHYHGHGSGDYEKESQLFDNEELYMDEDNHDKNTAWNRFLASVRARLTVAQVAENVKAHASLTFDFLFLILISSIMCAIGLIENSNVYLLSSMLICPMMGPVMAGTFGSVIGHKRLMKTGVYNELIGLGIATVVGFCYGTFICTITDKYGNDTWPTREMLPRGELRSLWVGCLIGLLSGAAVALGILSDNIASLVGVAISTSLTPPAVNAGLLWSLASVYYLKGNKSSSYENLTQTSYYSQNYAIELLALGGVSICLTFMNIICIYFAAILVFKVKEVAPMASRDQARRRFWKHDIKIARDFNKTLENDRTGCMITKISEELAAYQKSGFNKDHLCHSTDLAKDNIKLNIKRSEFTWSPCTHFNKKSKEIADIYENLKTSRYRIRNFNQRQSTSNEDQQRRLSQIFIKDDETLKAIIESRGNIIVNPEYTSGSQNDIEEHIVITGSKKFTVTPCNTDPLNLKL